MARVAILRSPSIITRALNHVIFHYILTTSIHTSIGGGGGGGGYNVIDVHSFKDLFVINFVVLFDKTNNPSEDSKIRKQNIPIKKC